MTSIQPGHMVEFSYTNHIGETARRTVLYCALQFGSNEFYPEPQWFLYGVCRDRKAFRSFALNKIVGEPGLV